SRADVVDHSVGVGAPYNVWHGAGELMEIVEAFCQRQLLVALCGDVRDVALQQPGTAMLVADGRADLRHPFDLTIAGNQPVADVEGTTHAHRVPHVLLYGIAILRMNQRLEAQAPVIDEGRWRPAGEGLAPGADKQHGPGGIVVTEVSHTWQVVQQKLLVQQT